MKVMIEIPKEFESDLQDNFKEIFERLIEDVNYALDNGEPLLCGNYERETAEMFLKAFDNAIVITDDATNGDVVKLLFPNGKYGTNGNFVYVYIPFGSIIQTMTFDLSVWNAPYQKGTEECHTHDTE